jgi:hypothetical protein
LTNGWRFDSLSGIDSRIQGMTGKSPLSATDEQRASLTVLAGSRDRSEADGARAVLLTLADQCSHQTNRWAGACSCAFGRGFDRSVDSRTNKRFCKSMTCAKISAKFGLND